MYSEKYYHTYCDIHGNEFRVSLRVWDYSGSATEVECGPEQFVIERENSSDLKLGGVYGSRATATFVSDTGFDLEELYTGDELTYLLVRLKNGSLDWQGNVIPDGFTQGNWDDRRPILTVRASDNLSTLKGKQFVDELGDNYGDGDGEYMQTFLWVIKEGLKKTGFSMPIWTMVDLKTLVQYELTPIIEEVIRWAEHELRTQPVTPQRSDELTAVIRQGLKIRVTDGPYTGTIYTVSTVSSLYISSSQRIVSVIVQESVVSGVSFTDFEVYEDDAPPGLVLSRRGHFNDFAPSEIGIYKKPTNSPGETAVDFSFLQIGDTVKISESAAGNNGTYTVTGFANSVPPDSPYIRIQLSPQVPVTIHENVILEIISQSTDYPDPLTTVHNIRTWIQDSNIEGKTYFEARGGAMMTFEVLDAIARQFGAIVQQNNGHWEVRRWNADKIDDGQYQWFVYDSEGDYTRREYFGGDTLLPCVATETEYRIFGTTMKMDRVLKYAIVNYRYKYNREGDSLLNMIVNGDFEGDFSPYPRGWDRIKADNNSLTDMVITRLTSGLPPGKNSGINIANYANTRTLTNMTVLSNTEVNKGDNLTISWWERINDGSSSDSSVGIYALTIFESYSHALGKPIPGRRAGEAYNYTTKAYDLVNNGIETGRQTGIKTETLIGRWRDQQEEGSGYKHFRFESPSTSEYGEWRKIEIKIDEVPINGFLKFEVLGTAKVSLYIPSTTSITVSPVYILNPNRPRGQSTLEYVPGYRPYYGTSDPATLDVTGFFIGKLIDPDSEAVPQIDPFMYPDFQAQLDRHYSDTIPEIEVLTGDDYGQYAEDRISSMWWNGLRTTMWDTWDSRFGWSRQGLVLAKSVMEMYWKPTRLLDCEISAPGLHWSSRIQFEELPGKRFVILRGAIGGNRSTFRGTLTEIHDDADAPLPPGGDDGGNTVDPNWQPTGVTRCVRDMNTGLNTGGVESVERDVNQASPTYGQERWVNAGTDTDLCPIGEPIDFYWGASTLPIGHETLEYFPYVKGGDNYTMQFTNDGTGKYLVFLWRKSLGTVQSILDVELEETISSWVVESDVTINGYTYGVMRMSYMTGVFTGLDKTFKIN